MKVNAFLLIFIGILIAAGHVQTQDKSGPINLDCGLVPKDQSYTETLLRERYISDARFIETGESKSIKSEYRTQLLQHVWFLRSFPEGTRNCYTLNVTKDKKYLIKASFLYGNSDGQNVLPSFDLYLGPNKWTSVKIKGDLKDTVEELIYVTRSTPLHICLVKTGTTTPFISSLELRPLNNESYNVQSGALLKLFRVSLTSTDSLTRLIRSPEDIHDRLWSPYFQADWTEINTTLDMKTFNDYDIPQDVVRSAAIPKNSSRPLTITWSLDNPNTNIYVYLHFAEIEKLKSNETREFNVVEDGKSTLLEPFVPEYLRVGTIADTRAKSCESGNCDISLVRTARSTHPPILNAVECYAVLTLPTLETHEDDVKAVTNIKAKYGLSRVSWQGDPCGPREFMWEGLNCSWKDSEYPRITSLRLSSAGLTGKITPYIQNLTALKILDLSHNKLTGGFPEFLAKMEFLSSIDLSGNNLGGSVPDTILEKTKAGLLKLNVEGNEITCGKDACGSKPSKSNVLVPIVASGASMVVLIAVLATFFIFRTRKKKRDEGIRNMKKKSNNIDSPAIRRAERRFSYAEVVRMTDNFKKVLGKGGFGEVYHGYLNDHEQVAMKLLSHSSSQGYKQFKAEVEVLLRIHHRNLVNLVGYCDEGEYSALIYEYMANGDLRGHLSGKQGSNMLCWADRIRIAAEAAQGLEYLHNGCKPPIIHRDVKTANILLNECFQAKLADFGLSRAFSLESQSHVSTAAVGTPGYIDPEYYGTNWLSEKSDVYSFGIVLLEIVTDRAVIDRTRERVHIAEWVSMMLTGGDITAIIERRLQEDFDINVAWKVVELAMNCVNRSPSRRPTMVQVVMELNECWATEKARMQGSREMEHLGESPTVAISVVNEFAPEAR